MPQIWDAISGSVKQEFYNVSNHDITAVCLDDRKRKFVTGNTNGTRAARLRHLVYAADESILVSTLCHAPQSPRCVVRVCHWRALRGLLSARTWSMMARRLVSFVAPRCTGDISVYTYNSGALMKEQKVTHSAEITAMAYVDKDRQVRPSCCGSRALTHLSCGRLALR